MGIKKYYTNIAYRITCFICLRAIILHIMNTLLLATLQAQYDVIVKVLIETNFNKKKAAEILEIDRKTLYNKLKEFENTPGIKKLAATATV